MGKKHEEFYRNPEKYIPVNETGDFYLRCFFDRYAGLRLVKMLPIFERAYSLLTERGNFSRRKAFGEMHADGYLWIEKHPSIKVIVEERQSFSFIYISDGYSFHIRELYYQWVYPAYKRSKLRGITVAKFRKQDFAPMCPENIEYRFNAFCYGDCRDEGYIASVKSMYNGMEEVDRADAYSLFAIDSMKFWEPYLDDPGELE